MIFFLLQDLDPTDSCFRAQIPVKIELTPDYSWVAMDEAGKRDADARSLAPTVVHANRTMFMIRVHYYVQVSLVFGMLRRGVTLKLPFLVRRRRDPKAVDKPPAALKEAAAAAAALSGGVAARNGKMDKKEPDKEDIAKVEEPPKAK